MRGRERERERDTQRDRMRERGRRCVAGRDGRRQIERGGCMRESAGRRVANQQRERQGDWLRAHACQGDDKRTSGGRHPCGPSAANEGVWMDKRGEHSHKLAWAVDATGFTEGRRWMGYVAGGWDGTRRRFADKCMVEDGK
eukprot:scaffold76_cov363-Pavlova_lutheri.AAC.17